MCWHSFSWKLLEIIANRILFTVLFPTCDKMQSLPFTNHLIWGDFINAGFPGLSTLIYWQLPMPAVQNILFHWYDFPPLVSHSSLLLHSLANLFFFFPCMQEASVGLLWAIKGRGKMQGWPGEKEIQNNRGVSANLPAWFSDAHMCKPQKTLISFRDFLERRECNNEAHNSTDIMKCYIVTKCLPCLFMSS